MKKNLVKSLLIFLVLSLGFMLLSSNALAINPAPPYLDLTGDFQYSDGKQGSGPTGTQYRLDLNDADITQVIYTDGTVSCDTAIFGCIPTASEEDDVLSWSYTFGFLNNDNGWDNKNNPVNSSLEFAPDPIQVSITDGANTYMTADLSFFDVVLDNPPTGGETQRVNWNYDDVNLTNFSFLTGYDNSRYLTELYDHAITNSGPVAMHIEFGFNSGCDPDTGEDCDFSRDAIGTFDGKAVAPEPVSSILFLTGGSMLAFRRYRKK